MGGKQQSSILQFFKPKDNNCFQDRADITVRNVCQASDDLIDDSKENEQPEVEKESDKKPEQAHDSKALSCDEQSDECNDDSQNIENNISDGLSEFERERLSRIERNRETMKALGLGVDKFRFGEVANKAKAQQRKRKPKSVPQHPVRRSLRNKGGVSVENGMENERNIAKENEDGNIQEPHFVDSNVLQYVCGSMDDRIKRSLVDTDDTCNAFREHHRCMYDSALQRAYSIDWTEDGASLVVAGGKNGHVSVFGSREIEKAVGNNTKSDNQNELCDDNIPPLMSERLHKGWVSDVQWVSRECSNNGIDMEHCPFLLTSSNDGSLALWDISVKDENTNMPKRAYFSDSLHDAGIFSMHFAKSNTILTASKDGSVALTNLYSERPFHVFRDLHGGGVVKCARWRSTTDEQDLVFASSGNDCVVRVVDAKTKSDIVEFHGHTTVTNVVQWNPKNSNIFLSTSHDPEIRVFDIRNPSEPLQELSGHSQGNRLSGIYQPVFVNDGKRILAPGVGSSSQMLTMFDIASGEIISRGDIGCAAGATFSTGNRCDPVIVSGSKRLSFLYPSRL